MKDKKKRSGNLRMFVGLLLVVAAFLFTGFNLWSEKQAELAANGVLKRFNQSISAETDQTASLINLQEKSIPDYILNPQMDMPTIDIDGNKYIGKLDIPSLAISLPVMSEWSYPNMQIAPNRYKGSAYTDDLIILGHNYRTHFGGLSNLEYGDKILFTDSDDNAFTYEVVEIEVIEQTDVEKMESGDWDLTLFTCRLDRQDRLTIRCEKIE